MNKNTSIILGVIIVLLVGGFIIYSNSKKASDTLSSTNNTVTVNSDTTPTTNPVDKVGTSPRVVTSSKTSASDTTAIITGLVTPNNAFTSYWFEYGNTVNMGTKTSNQSVGSGNVAIASPGYIVGLTKDTTYYFRLVAENKYGKVEGAQYSFETTHGNPAPVGGTPKATTSSSVVGISQTQATLQGEVNPNKSTTVYWFEYGETANLGNTTGFTTVGANSGTVGVSTKVSDLNADTTYYFRINAQNQFNTVNGSILTFKTTGPTATSAPTVTTNSANVLSTSSASLHGKVNPNGLETNYWFEYSTDSLLGSVLIQKTDRAPAGSGTSTVSVNLDISDLSPKTTYYFRMVAENDKGLVQGSRMSFKTK